MKKITLTAAEIAQLVGGELLGDPARAINSVAAIRQAKTDDLSFASSKRLLPELESCPAGVVLICKELAKASTESKTLIVCADVEGAIAKVLALFAEEPPAWERTVHPRAVVSPTAKLGKNVSIGANAVIEDGAEIGDNTVIGAGCYIGHEVKIGSDSILYPNVTVMYRCIIGKLAVIHPGVVIGGDGFGFVPGPQGLVKVPQTGIVQIDDDVEIGANTTICRARFGKTWIKSNVKIDGQVMIGHNVIIGESSVLVAQSGIAGSTELGRGVMLAAKAGVAGHLVLGDGAKIAAVSVTHRNMRPGEVGIGLPIEGQREFMARLALPVRVNRLAEKLDKLKAEVEELKK